MRTWTGHQQKNTDEEEKCYIIITNGINSSLMYLKKAWLDVLRRERKNIDKERVELETEGREGDIEDSERQKRERKRRQGNFKVNENR